MLKKRFYSQLFQRYIEKTDKDFRSYVIAELLFRIDALETANCDCMKCTFDLKKYKDYYKKLKSKK